MKGNGKVHFYVIFHLEVIIFTDGMIAALGKEKSMITTKLESTTDTKYNFLLFLQNFTNIIFGFTLVSTIAILQKSKTL